LLEITVLDTVFNKWYKNIIAFTGVFNQNLTKTLNQEFRMKLEAWKRRKNER